MRCFHEKFTQLELFLHDRRSRRSRQISSLTIGSEIGSPPYRSSSLAINGGINSHPMRIESSLLFPLQNHFSLLFKAMLFFQEKLLQSNIFDKSTATYTNPNGVPSLENVYIPNKKGKIIAFRFSMGCIRYAFEMCEIFKVISETNTYFS